MRRRDRARLAQFASSRSWRLDERSLAAKEDAFAFAGGHPANIEVYEPRETSLVPKGGAWVFVTRNLPPLERDLHERVRVGCVFWAEHGSDNCDDEGFESDGTYKVRITTPWGDVWLWPYEYHCIAPERVIESWAAGALQFHQSKLGDTQFNEIMFFAMSRGIHRADALVMALGTFSGAVGWFEPDASIADSLTAMATRLYQWPALGPENHARRARARAQRRKEEASCE